MTDNKKQYRYEIWEAGVLPLARIASGEIDDPFLRTVIRPKGWRAAWAVLMGRLEFTLQVDGTKAAYRAVFLSDYTPQPEGPPVLMGTDDTAEAEP